MRWLTSALVCALALSAQSSRIESLAPYYPTPEAIVDRMLQLGGLHGGEKMFDLGSGDGRIVIMAARKYKADATGVEFEETLVKQSMKRIASLGLASTARIIHGDLLKADYTSADLLTTGDGVIIQVDLKAHRPVEDPVISFALHDRNNQFVFGTNSDWRQKRFHPFEGKKRLRFNLRNLPFVRGKFWVTLGVHSKDASAVYHVQEQRYSFEVEHGAENPGEVFIPFHYDEACANWLTDDEFDPISREPNYKQCAVRLETIRNGDAWTG